MPDDDSSVVRGEMNDGPLRHIYRTPLPWRGADKTVCGKPVTHYPPELVLSLDDAKALFRKLGKQRAAMVTCMTCVNNVDRWTKWDDNPVARMARECDRAFGLRPDDRDLVTRELRAIAMLIERHRAEFDELVVGLDSVVTMGELRRKRAERH